MTTYNILIIISVVFIALSLFLTVCIYGRKNLKKEKINLIKLLEKSEETRIKMEAEQKIISLIFNHFTDGIIIIDTKDKISLMNPEAIKILELDSEKLFGKPFQFMMGFPKAKTITTILESGIKNIHRKEVEVEKGFIIELSVVPLDMGRNTINRMLIIHDISKAKMIEQMKTQFVSLAAHQLRTPLSIIKWSMDMLLHGDFGKMTKKQNDAIVNIFNSNEKLISLVDDLLDVAHIEEGRYLHKTEFTNVNDLILSVLENCNIDIKNKKIKVEFNIQKDLPKTSIDKEKIKLVIQNLIENAIKYSPKSSKIIIQTKNINNNIEIKVQDFGIGIPKNQQEKIFIEFFRGSNAIKETTGSGLGLFLSKNIIDAHNGKIWFESEENKGTTFFINLPIINI